MIIINVIGQKMHLSSCPEPTAPGSQNFVKFKFILGEEWTNLKVFAQFQQKGLAYNKYLDSLNSVYLPAEISSGTYTLMLYGSDSDVIATTNFLTFKMGEGKYIEDSSSTDITPSLYEQLVEKVESINSVKEELVKEAVKTEIIKYIDDGTISEITTVVDSELSETSENAIQNAVVTKELKSKLNTADTFFHVSSLSGTENPELIAYQTEDTTTPKMLRIPLNLIKEEKDFINLEKFNDLDSLISYPYGFNKVYKIELTADLSAELPKGVYIGRFYVLGSEFLELTSFVADGKSYKVNLDTGDITVSYTDDFINAGSFENLEELNSYGFEYDKVYKIYLENEIVTSNEVEILYGHYTCIREKHEVDNDICVRLVPFAPTGYWYILNLTRNECSEFDVTHYEDIEYLVEELDKKANKSEVKVDQSFDATSKNAQSGVAVAEALEKAGVTGGRKVIEDLNNYMPDSGTYGLENYLVYNYRTEGKVGTRMTLAELRTLMVGDIDTALANIISLQESYIGGAVE